MNFGRGSVISKGSGSAFSESLNLGQGMLDKVCLDKEENSQIHNLIKYYQLHRHSKPCRTWFSLTLGSFL